MTAYATNVTQQEAAKDAKRPLFDRAEAAIRARPTVTLFLLVAVALILLGFVVERRPVLTLQYVRALTWPVAAVLLVLIFRGPIAALLNRIEGGRVDTPFGSGEFRAGGTPSAPRTPPDERADERVRSETEPPLPGLAPQEDPALLRMTADFSRILNAAFEAQLAFLRWLQAAPAGVTWQTVVQYYEGLQAAPSSGWAGVPLANFTGFLANERLIEVDPNGMYRLSERGEQFLQFAGATFYARKTF